MLGERLLAHGDVGVDRPVLHDLFLGQAHGLADSLEGLAEGEGHIRQSCRVYENPIIFVKKAAQENPAVLR